MEGVTYKPDKICDLHLPQPPPHEAPSPLLSRAGEIGVDRLVRLADQHAPVVALLIWAIPAGEDLRRRIRAELNSILGLTLRSARIFASEVGTPSRRGQDAT